MDNRAKTVFKKAWREMLAIIITIIGGVIAIFDASNKIIAAILVVFGLLVLVYEVYQKYYDYEEKIDSFENSRPNLERSSRCAVFPVNPIGSETTTTATTLTFSSPDMKSLEIPDWLRPNSWRDPSSDLVDYEKDNQGWFALVEFRNKPIESIDKSVAREVSAHIYYYDKSNEPRINQKGISGRWWSNEEVALSNKPRRELERTDIYPNSQPVIFALAFMGTKGSVIYGYNNDNHRYKEFKKDEFSLGLGSYFIHVVLSGINLNPQHYWFEVWKDKQSRELRIKDIEKPNGISENER